MLNKGIDEPGWQTCKSRINDFSPNPVRSLRKFLREIRHILERMIVVRIYTLCTNYHLPLTNFLAWIIHCCSQWPMKIIRSSFANRRHNQNTQKGHSHLILCLKRHACLDRERSREAKGILREEESRITRRTSDTEKQ